MSTKSKEFLALQKTWYDKLKEEGFEDIETVEGVDGSEEGRLKLSSWQPFTSRNNPSRVSERQEYFRLVGHFLHDHKFESTEDKILWQLHGEGWSTHAIAKYFIGLGVKINQMTIYRRIKKLQLIMKAKYGQQSNSN